MRCAQLSLSQFVVKQKHQTVVNALLKYIGNTIFYIFICASIHCFFPIFISIYCFKFYFKMWFISIYILLERHRVCISINNARETLLSLIRFVYIYTYIDSVCMFIIYTNAVFRFKYLTFLWRFIHFFIVLDIYVHLEIK